MGRIIKSIEIEGRPAIALFDTGATYTYVRSELIQRAPGRPFAKPVHMGLGGREIEIHEVRLIEGKIEGLDFSTDAVPIDELGRADGHALDAIIGARTMEQWEIRLDPSTSALGLEGLRRREFTEY